MAGGMPRVTLIYNETAGEGGHSRAELVDLIARDGWEVSAFSAKEGGLAEILARPTELIVAAGGDGTVRRVAVAASASGPPLAILPLGTANNIADSLGIAGKLPHLVAGWRRARRQPFHLLAVEGPWGVRRLIEGVGVGALAEAMAELKRGDHGVESARQRIADKILTATAEPLEIAADGKRSAGAVALCEVTTIPLVGPNLRLAPGADPADRRIEICTLGAAASDRRAFADWVAQGAAGPVPLAVLAAGRVTLAGQCRSLRLDDDAWSCDPGLPVSVTLTPEPEPLRLLVPG